MSEIESGPTVKQPWEYQAGWARQKLLPSELGSFMKGLLGGLHLPLDPQARPDRVRANQKELQRRAARTQEAQNKLRFWAKSEIGTKDSNFINILQQLYRKQQESLKMQTENNKTFNTLYNKFLLIEKNKANTIKHLGAEKQYLTEGLNSGSRDSTEYEVQDEDPVSKWTLPIIGLLLGGALANRGLASRAMKKSANVTHRKLRDEILKDPKMTDARLGSRAVDLSGTPQYVPWYSKLPVEQAKMPWYSKLPPHMLATGVGLANAVYGYHNDTRDNKQGLTDHSTVDHVLRFGQRLAGPIVVGSMMRGVAGSRIGPRQALRKWSKKHQNMVKSIESQTEAQRKNMSSSDLASYRASKALTSASGASNVPLNYKGTKFGRIYDLNPVVGLKAWQSQPRWTDLRNASKTAGQAGNAGTSILGYLGTGTKFLAKLGRDVGIHSGVVSPVAPYVKKNPYYRMRLQSADTGRGIGAGIGSAAAAALFAPEILSGLNYFKSKFADEIPLLGDLTNIIPDFNTAGKGTLFDRITRIPSDDLPSPTGERYGINRFTTRSPEGTDKLSPVAQIKLAKQQAVRENTKPSGEPVPWSSEMNPDQKPRVLVQRDYRNWLPKLFDLVSGDPPPRTIFYTQHDNRGQPISDRSTKMAEDEKNAIIELLRRQRDQ